MSSTGQPVLYMSLEMSAAEITRRVLAAEGRIPMERLKTHTLTDTD